MVGFSAGGEVILMSAFGDTAGITNAPDPIDQANARPDYIVEIYPGGGGIPQALPANAPPAFLLVADDDDHTTAVLKLFTLYRAAKIPVEVHVFTRGPATPLGVGTGSHLPADDHQRLRRERLADWMGDNNILNPAVASTNAVVQNTAIIPVPRDPKWVHATKDSWRRRTGGMDILFVGDSITDSGATGAERLEPDYAPLHALNLGISGDRTEHVLWRLENGELAGIDPKVVVLMIGTNNTGWERDKVTPRCSAPEDTIEGVKAVVHELRVRLPAARILLLAVFPRGTLDDPQRAQVALINTVDCQARRWQNGAVSRH